MKSSFSAARGGCRLLDHIDYMHLSMAVLYCLQCIASHGTLMYADLKQVVHYGPREGSGVVHGMLGEVGIPQGLQGCWTGLGILV